MKPRTVTGVCADGRDALDQLNSEVLEESRNMESQPWLEGSAGPGSSLSLIVQGDAVVGWSISKPYEVTQQQLADGTEDDRNSGHLQD